MIHFGTTLCLGLFGLSTAILVLVALATALLLPSSV